MEWILGWGCYTLSLNEGLNGEGLNEEFENDRLLNPPSLLGGFWWSIGTIMTAVAIALVSDFCLGFWVWLTFRFSGL